jgi:hypothetical protein
MNLLASAVTSFVASRANNKLLNNKNDQKTLILNRKRTAPDRMRTPIRQNQFALCVETNHNPAFPTQKVHALVRWT